MRIRAFALLAALAFTAPAHAATEFEDGYVPVELVSLLLGNGRIYRSLPDDFPVVRPSAAVDVSLVGSFDHPDVQQVLLRSAQGGRTLLAALRDAYVAAGWLEISGVMGTFTLLCHDTHGDLQMMMRDDGELLPVMRIRNRAWLSCADQLAAREGMDTTVTYAASLMPAFTNPPQTLGQASDLNTGLRSVGSTRLVSDRHIRLVAPGTDLAGVHAHFAGQLAEAGWINDTTAHGSSTIMSAWYRTAAAPRYAPEAGDSELSFTLTVQEIGRDDYRVQAGFHAVLAPGAVRGDGAVDPDVLGAPLPSSTLGIRGVFAGFESGNPSTGD